MGLSDRMAGLPAGVAHETWPTSISELREAARLLKQVDMTAGGGWKLDSIIGMSHNAVALLDEHPSPARSEATGWLVSNAGFMAFDSGRLVDAAQLWGVALAAAQEAGNTSLQARVLGSMSRQAIWQDRPLEALTRIEEAQALTRLTAVERAMLWALTAKAEAQAGNVRGVDRAAGRADELLAVGGDVEDRPWIAHYGQPHQDGDIATAYSTLALTHRHRNVTEATGRFDAAIDAHGPDAARSQTISLAILATVDVGVGDFEHGMATGWDALDAAEGMRSWRLSEELGHLDGALAQHAGRADVDELRHQLGHLVTI
jgi:hypothetical protein